jgi:hypothetical protein
MLLAVNICPVRLHQYDKNKPTSTPRTCPPFLHKHFQSHTESKSLSLRKRCVYLHNSPKINFPRAFPERTETAHCLLQAGCNVSQNRKRRYARMTLILDGQIGQLILLHRVTIWSCLLRTERKILLCCELRLPERVISQNASYRSPNRFASFVHMRHIAELCLVCQPLDDQLDKSGSEA